MTVITDESLGPIDFTVWVKYIKIHVLQVTCKGKKKFQLGICDDSESIASICFAPRTFFGVYTAPTKL